VDHLKTLRLLTLSVFMFGAMLAGCDGIPQIDIDDLIPTPTPTPTPTASPGGDGTETGDSLETVVFASNTGGASGIALRPSDGALFLVNSEGLFGPIDDGDDVSTLEPIGATNLADADLFGSESDLSHLVLAIANSGEFWIGLPPNKELAVVPPAGGDAESFTGLVVDSNIAPETMVIVPEGFAGDQMEPGNLLVGQDTTFSRLSAIDVEGDRTVVNVDNPLEDDPDNELNRQAHHLTFSPDGVLYSCKRLTSATMAGLQTIATDGTPTDVAGTERLAADSFVALDGGDLILRGIYDPADGDQTTGLLIWSAADEEVQIGLEMTSTEVSADDEMILAADGETVYLSLPERDEIVVVVDNR